MKKAVSNLIRTRASKNWEHQKKSFLQKDAGRVFFKNVKPYRTREKPTTFDIRSLCPTGKSDAQVAERLADHFNGISNEFSGLDPADIPETYTSPLPPITPLQVSKRLKEFKKQKSMVRHDIFPTLINDVASYLAGPLAHIYNSITTSHCWSLIWKQEFVTPIPKKYVPDSVNDLRNISYTALFSKVYKSFVLCWLQEQVGIRQNEMGGMRGASTVTLLSLVEGGNGKCGPRALIFFLPEGWSGAQQNVGPRAEKIMMPKGCISHYRLRHY